MSDAIKFRVKHDEIQFDDWGDNLKSFINKIEVALGVKAKKKRFLIYVIRYDFKIDGELVPLGVNEDGTACIRLSKNSDPVKAKVIERFRRSSDFQEV